MSSTARKIFYFTIFFAVLVWVGVGYLYLNQQYPAKLVNLLLPTINQAPYVGKYFATPSLTLTSSRDSKTYLDADFGFSFSYPETYALKVLFPNSSSEPLASIEKAVTLQSVSRIKDNRIPFLEFNVESTPFNMRVADFSSRLAENETLEGFSIRELSGKKWTSLDLQLFFFPLLEGEKTLTVLFNIDGKMNTDEIQQAASIVQSLRS